MGHNREEGVMPKELLYDTAAGDDIALEVSWSRDGHVQLATKNLDDTTPLVPSSGGNGWYMTPTRHQINELIRTLRRARDQAYGRDE